jgi:4,5-DOPA dioxygenase extradiol
LPEPVDRKKANSISGKDLSETSLTISKKSSPSTVVYLSHGGGPLPLLNDPGHRGLVENLVAIANSVPRPSAIVLISAHWEESLPTATSAGAPGLIYDYYGFPRESYEIEYPAPGLPSLADKIVGACRGRGIQAGSDAQRGFDHGMFVPLKIMYPDADIPCVQLSLLSGLSAARHIQLGKALSGKLGPDVLVIGSGFSFHNLKAFFSPPSAAFEAGNQAFERWLADTCTGTDLDENERENRLVNWEQAPAARLCHPREEHLLPLHVCYGLAQEPARQAYSFKVMGMRASAFVW